MAVNRSLVGRSIVIGTPVLDGKFVHQYVAALVPTFMMLRDLGALVSLRAVAQDSLVMRARNLIVAHFWLSGATDLLFIDSDIGWRPPDVLRLLSYDVPLVAGVYRRKLERLGFAVAFADPARISPDPVTGLLEASRVGTGFMRIRRDCIAAMMAGFPQLRYAPEEEPELAGGCYSLFDTSQKDGAYMGEDYTFCDRWRSLDGKVWVDSQIELEHVGTRVFTGTIREALRSTKP